MRFQGLVGLVAMCAPVPALAQTGMRLALDTPQSATLDAGDPRDEYGSPGESWTFDAAPGVVYRVSMQSTAFDAALAVDAGSAVLRPPNVYDDSSKPGADHSDSSASFSTTRATTVRIRAGTVQRGAIGAYTIRIVSQGSCAEIDRKMDVGFIYGCPQKPAATPAEIERDRQVALAELRTKVDAGDPWGFFGMGMVAYSQSRQAEAAPLFDRAYTSGGIERAGLTLAEIHSNPNVSFPGHDPARAVKIWTELADRGSTEALEKLAWAYEYGKAGLALSQSRALDYHARAALAGSLKSTLLLARLYDGDANADAGGTGRPDSDYVRRLKAQRRASQLSAAPDPAVSTRWWGLAAQRNDRAAMFEYSQRLESGIGIAPNREEALRWLRKAALAGNAEAAAKLKVAVAAGFFR